MGNMVLVIQTTDMATEFILFIWPQYPFKNTFAIPYTNQTEVSLEIAYFLACHLEGKLAYNCFTGIEH